MKGYVFLTDGRQEQRCLRKSEMCLKFLGSGMVIYPTRASDLYANIKELGFTVSDQMFYKEDVM